MNWRRLLISILLLPVFFIFTNQRKDPELLEIPGAEGVSVDFFTNLLNQPAPTQNIPALNVGAAQQVPGLNVGAAQQMPLQQIAGMTGTEKFVQQLLGQFLQSDPTKGDAYQLGMGEIKKTLGGEFYDPKTSDFWKGYRETSEIEQEKGVAGIRRRGQLGGGLYATPNQRTEADYVKGMGASRTMMLGSLFERERDRKQTAVGQALGYAGFGEEAKANRIALGSTVGAIPRNIQDRRSEALYNQQFGQSESDYRQQVRRNESVYAQALGQSQADYQQQRLGNLSEYNQALGQSQADYDTALFPYTHQSPIAAALMPQWHIDESDSGMGGFWGFLGSILGLGL